MGMLFVVVKSHQQVLVLLTESIKSIYPCKRLKADAVNQGGAELNRLLVLNFPNFHWSIRFLHLLAAVVTLSLLDLPIVRPLGWWVRVIRAPPLEPPLLQYSKRFGRVLFDYNNHHSLRLVLH